MAEVTGLTAERMLEIEAEVIVDAALVGDDLVLEKHSGETINVGSVRGPQGEDGPVGTPAAVAAILQLMSGTPAIPSGGAQVTGLTEILDTDSLVSGDTIVIDRDGLWQLGGGIAWSNGYSGLLTGSIQVNGVNTGIAQTVSGNTATNGTGGSMSGPVQLEVGDVVRLFAYQASGGSVNLVTNAFPQNRLSAHFIG